MTTWSCAYCTLINSTSSHLCEGCGSQNPQNSKSIIEKGASLLPTFLSKGVKEISSAVNELLTNNKKPGHYFVRYPLYQNSPSTVSESCSNSSNHIPSSSSTFFVNEFPSQSMSSEITSKVKNEVQKESDKVYNNILNYCVKTNSPFIDPSFPHSNRSIGVLKYKKNNKDIVGQPNFIKWLRPENIYTKDGTSLPWTVFNHSPQPSDIEQGTLVGNCWLISAMALIAERPDILHEIFPSTEYSYYGIYRIKVCVEGEWKVIIVDDFLPCYKNTNSLAIAIGRRNQLWVCLIEKALAKALGSYSKLHGASLAQGLSMLTGASCVNYITPNNEEEIDTFWAQVVSSKESGFLMCCVTKSTIPENELKVKGLLINHAYSILDIATQNNHRLLRIRNPWGTFVWNGKWSDTWKFWTPEMRNKLLTSRGKETGAFWMELDDFVTLFSSITVCKIRPDWSELRQTQLIGWEADENSKMMHLTALEKCEASFMVFQKNSFGADDATLKDLMLCIHRQASNGRIGELVGRSHRLTDRSLTTDEFFLEPGNYLVICLSMKNRKEKFLVNIVTHSSLPLFGQMIPYRPGMSADCLRQVVLKHGNLLSNVENGIQIRTLTTHFRGMVVMADNNLENRWLHIGVDCSESINIQSSRGDLNTTDVVPPLGRQIIVILSTIDDYAEYKVANSLKSLVSNKKYISKEMNYEATIVGKHLKNYPIIDENDDLHSTVSVFSSL